MDVVLIVHVPTCIYVDPNLRPMHSFGLGLNVLNLYRTPIQVALVYTFV